jgi:N-acetylmuramoyl-L-alanine amidase
MRKLLLALFSVVGVAILINPVQAQDESAARFLKTIVIDPGHGGQDRGVAGLSGLLEKDLSLTLALQLAETLRQRLGIRVILTRDGDYPLDLAERTAIANHQRADLFLSLHFNADFSGRGQGMEIYILNNSTLEAKGENITPAAEAVFWSQAQLDSLAESSQLAQAIYQQATDSPYLKNIRLCSAPLLVLQGASMPAVLVELAYLSHHQSEEELWDQDYKTALVELIYQGILNYKRGFIGNISGYQNECWQE